MVNAQMLFKLCHGDNAIEVGRACYFYGHHVAKIRLKKKPPEGLFNSRGRIRFGRCGQVPLETIRVRCSLEVSEEVNF